MLGILSFSDAKGYRLNGRANEATRRPRSRSPSLRRPDRECKRERRQPRGWSGNRGLVCGIPAVALEPQLVDRASRGPEGDSWIHEIKYDGYRLLAAVQRGKVWLYSRCGADWTARLPWIAKAVRA